MINMEVVKVPGPGSYDPVNPKAIRNKDYGSYYKGPLPFLVNLFRWIIYKLFFLLF